MNSVPWPHAPTHRLSENATYFVTAGTCQKCHHFHDPMRLDVLHRGVLTVAAEFGWRLEAWCVFPNHYHFVAHSPDAGAGSLEPMIRKLDSKLAIWANKLDSTPGRQVWHNYWETQLSYEKSYLARLHYTHANAVHHGLVPIANQYPWCSAAWFERTATTAQVQTIYGMKIDSVQVADDFDVKCGSLLPLSKAAASRRTPNEAGQDNGGERSVGNANVLWRLL